MYSSSTFQPRLLIRRYSTFPDSVTSKWPWPNYIDPERRGPELYIINSIFFVCTMLCVALRLYTRIFIRRWLGADDLFLIIAALGAVGVSAVVMLGYRQYDWDRHIWDLHLDLVDSSGKTLYASKLLWSATSNSVRASVMCLFYRLLDHVGLNRWRWVLHLNSIFILGIFLEQQGTFIFGCWPIYAMWTYPVLKDSRCINTTAVQMSSAVLNTFSELVVAILPIPVIMNLEMSQKQRTEVIVLLCGGFLVVICGCVRTYILWRSCDSYDPSWWASPHWIASEVEMDVAIICSCLPILRPVAGRVFTRGFAAAREKNALASGNHKPSLRSRQFKGLLRFGHNHSQASGAFSSNTTNSLSSGPDCRRDFDLEGIGNDGLGYTVTIRTSTGTRVKKRWDIRNKTWHYYPEELVLEEDQGGIAPKSQTRSMLSTFHRDSGDNSRARTSQGERKSYREKAIPVVMESSTFLGDPTPFEEKPRPNLETTFYTYSTSTITPVIPISTPDDYADKVQIAHNGRDFSRSHSYSLPQPMSRAILRDKLPEVAQTQSRSSFDQAPNDRAVKKPRMTVDTSVTSQDKIRNHDNFRVGVLPSPSTPPDRPLPPTPPFQMNETRTMHARPAPLPALPPSARFPRIAMPVVQPLNSSQIWATSPHLFMQRSRSEQDEGVRRQHRSHQNLTTGIADPEEDPGRLEAFLGQQARPALQNSSMQGEGGLIKSSQRTRNELESSDEDLELPLQLPSPRSPRRRTQDIPDTRVLARR